jgi:hypothetical protein
MSRDVSHRQRGIRHDGSVSVRERAYAEALGRLSGRRSFADRLTDDQLRLINEDLPFEIGSTEAPLFSGVSSN